MFNCHDIEVLYISKCLYLLHYIAANLYIPVTELMTQWSRHEKILFGKSFYGHSQMTPKPKCRVAELERPANEFLQLRKQIFPPLPGLPGHM